jgi:ERCC4-related helicase
MLREEMEKVSTSDDSKLQHLKSHLLEKIQNPINPGNKKVLIFTAFADTANYLYNELSKSTPQHNIEIARITGSDKSKTTLGKGFDYQKILTFFSPGSKEKDLIYPDEKGEIHVLIGTDCISEGQNLQDCD